MAKVKQVPMTPERYQQFLDEAETLMSAFNRQASAQAAKETHFCGAGCANCCCQVFSLAQFEVDIVARRIENDPDLLARVQKTLAERRLRVQEKQEEIALIQENRESLEFVTAWLKLKIPCALLDQNNCLVYEIRPAICAIYLSLAPSRICAFEPKGYRSAAMQRLFLHYERDISELHKKYQMPSVAETFDISSSLDQILNPQVVQKSIKGNE